jgi:N6-adenosine-specific RNA methylase IME4
VSVPARVLTHEKLSTAEASDFKRLEAVVERGLDAFLEVASALIEIRGRRLYRASFPSFEAYAANRFGLKRRTVYGYIEAHRVFENVPPEAHLSLTHLRALAPLSATDQAQLAPVISEMTVAEARRVIREWRAQRRAELAAIPPAPPLPKGTYRTISSDPPWSYGKTGDWGDGLAADVFPTMETEEIAALPIGELAAADSHLYLWAPVSKLPDAVGVCQAWGFRYVSLLTWVKPGLGLGRYWRVSTEHVVFGIRGSLQTTPNLRNWFEAPRRRHSAKPDEFFDLVEQASPGPYLELFARRRRRGWDAWGNELTAVEG